MSGILTITLNPAVDYATSVEAVEPDRKLYCRTPRIDPGGGGVNVSRTIRKLGGESRAFVVAGGAMGERLTALLGAEGVACETCLVPGETRYSLAVTDERNGAQFRFSLPGEPLSDADGDAILAAIAQAAPPGGLVVLSGGVAPGLPDDFPQAVRRAIEPRTDRLIVDTSKAPLMHLIAAPTEPVHLLRLDRNEAEQAAGQTFREIGDSVEFAAGLIARGVARHIVTGQGAAGSIWVTADKRYFCSAPQVPVKSKIGAGDAFVGALTMALSQGEPPDQALRWGVAAASATVGTEGTALCTRDAFDALLPDCVVGEI